MPEACRYCRQSPKLQDFQEPAFRSSGQGGCDRDAVLNPDVKRPVSRETSDVIQPWRVPRCPRSPDGHHPPIATANIILWGSLKACRLGAPLLKVSVPQGPSQTQPSESGSEFHVMAASVLENVHPLDMIKRHPLDVLRCPLQL